MSLKINSSVLQDISQHLEAAYPYEACGFLLGTEKSGKRDVTEIITVENTSTENQKRRFVIDASDYLKAERHALKNDLILLGIFHSHPDHPAIPSIHDHEFAQPYFSYTIHSVLKGKLSDSKSYRLFNNIFEEENLTIYNPPPAFGN